MSDTKMTPGRAREILLRHGANWRDYPDEPLYDHETAEGALKIREEQAAFDLGAAAIGERGELVEALGSVLRHLHPEGFKPNDTDAGKAMRRTYEMLVARGIAALDGDGFYRWKTKGDGK